MTYRSFRFRLLAVILIGLITLAAANILNNQWMLVQVRDQAINDSSDALRQQAVATLQQQVQQRADATRQTLTSIKLISATASELLADGFTSGQPDPSIVLSDSQEGWRYQHGITTALVPPGDDPQALIDLAVSARMNSVFPGLARAFPEINRISYLASSGVYRTFPQIGLTRLSADSLPQQNPAYQAASPQNNPNTTIVWLDPHQAIDTSEQVISSVAPVYLRGQLMGVVIVDINLTKLTRPIRAVGSEFGGFGFVIDNDGHLISAPDPGQRLLMGRTMQPAEQGSIAIDQVNPAFAPVIEALRQRNTDAITIELNEQPYLMAHQPIAEMKWHVNIIAPAEQVTAATGEIAQGITSIANTARGMGLFVSLLVVVVLCAILFLVLHLRFSRPLARLLGATNAIAAGELHHVDVSSGDELGQLARAFNTMTDALAQSRAEILSTNQQLEQTVQKRTADLNVTVQKLEESSAKQQMLLRALRDASTPVIPIIDNVIAMPLIGLLDSERITNATNALLQRIEREHAQVVLLDVTGVPIIDTEVAQALLQIIAAANLLGAKVILVGVTPGVAQTIVSLGIPLHQIETSANIQSAIEHILPNRRAHPRALRAP